MNKRLWDKGTKLNEQVAQFTIERDPELDLRLVHFDCLGSAAHAKMLHKIGVLNDDECKALLGELQAIIADHEAGRFGIPPELEDCHTAIENRLVKNCGQAGLKIHTARSRNDQVLTATRLYIRAEILEVISLCASLSDTLFKRFHELGNLPMAGYTHMQPAMPASVGMWLHAHAEAFIDAIRDGLVLLDRINKNPLGAASGFGVPLGIDREYTAQLLGFSAVQRNPIHVQNSRGRASLKFIQWCIDIGSAIEKLAADISLYTTTEFGFISLPEELTTGSSIMPQKRNPDVIELLRARGARLRAKETELAWVMGKLPSSYHRDFQCTKGPLIDTAEEIQELLSVSTLCIETASFNKQALENSMHEELYATYDAYRRVSQGMPFREAYLETAKAAKEGSLNAKELAKDFDAIDAVNVKEAKEAERELGQLKKAVSDWESALNSVQEKAFAC